jgi:spermidine synthase
MAIMSARRDAKDRVTPAAKAAERLPDAFPPVVAAALVFIAAGAVLVLEILAVRLLAPYVGLTLETTTSIIGAALAGIAAGAAIGGYLADRTDTRRLIVGLLIGGGLLALLTVPLVRWLGPGARGDGDLAALGITLIALVPPAAVLSAVSPAVAHLQLHDLRKSGTIVGRLSAWATAGALLGTFGTGFVLVPLLPVSSAVLAIGAVLVVTGVALGATSRILSPVAAAAMAATAIALGGLSGVLDSPCDADTSYHCASIDVDPSRSGGRQLLLDDLHHSYVDLDDPSHLEYAYTRWIADAIGATSRPRAPLDVVFVGGGGFTLPRWLTATRPGSRAQVLEVDGELVDFVKERLGLRTSPELRVSVGDARVGLLDVRTDSADVVVGDAFGNLAVPWHLATVEWIDEIQRVLKPGGLYALNVVDLPPLDLLRAEAATLLDSFADVRLVAHVESGRRPSGGNALLIASDRSLPARAGSDADGALTFGRPWVKSFAADAQTLRDDDAPVDQLLTPSNL